MVIGFENNGLDIFKVHIMAEKVNMAYNVRVQGPVARSLVSANRWLKGMKTYRFPWYLTLVSANQASSKPGLVKTWHCLFVLQNPGP